MEKQSATFKVFGSDGAELRTITVETEKGKGFKKRAEALALEQIVEGEKIQFVTGPKEESGTKFTFEFEIYKNGVQDRIENVSALNDNEGDALDAAVTALKEKLGADETHRYTNKFQKESVE